MASENLDRTAAESDPGPVVGIDLGTTNSVVAYVIDGQPRVFSVDNQNLMPSVVALSPSGSLITGVAARNQLAAYPDRTVASIKRKMGRDEKVTMGDQSYSPPEISAMILRRLRDVASRELGRDVQRAVITVPAYFDEQQRQATRQAGELAGFKVERIINEPTAATLVYHVDKHDRKHIAVYDFGGGTFDVSVVRMEAGVIEVLSSQGDTQLGGDDIDHLLLDYVANDFKTKHEVDLRVDPQARFRLLQACEQAKIRLSEMETVSLAEEFIAEKNGQPLNLQLTITREQLNEMIEPLVDRTIDCVGKALRDASMNVHAIDDLVLVGGSTRIPLVADRLRDQFRREPSRAVDPDLAVALGAAVQGAMLQGQSVGPVLVDVATHTLGTAAVTSEGMFSTRLTYVPIIHRGSALPARYQEAFSKMYEEQERVEITVMQGEHPEPDRNRLIGTFMLELDKGSDDHDKILISFNLTLDGILQVTAEQPAAKRVGQIVINNALTEMDEEVRVQTQSRLDTMFEQSEQMTNLKELVPSAALSSDLRADAPHPNAYLPRPEVLEKAREKFPRSADLLERAQQLKSKIQGEDAEDLDVLCGKIYTALADGDDTEVENLTADLDDLLFYVQ